MVSSASVEGEVSVGVSSVRASGAAKAMCLRFLEKGPVLWSRMGDECNRLDLELMKMAALNVLQLGV